MKNSTSEYSKSAAIDSNEDESDTELETSEPGNFSAFPATTTLVNKSSEFFREVRTLTSEFANLIPQDLRVNAAQIMKKNPTVSVITAATIGGLGAALLTQYWLKNETDSTESVRATKRVRSRGAHH